MYPELVEYEYSAHLVAKLHSMSASNRDGSKRMTIYPALLNIVSENMAMQSNHCGHLGARDNSYVVDVGLGLVTSRPA